MKKFFNTAGPCRSDRNYMIPATRRLVEENVSLLIEQGSYFVVHAPRQVGKTTAMIEWERERIESGVRPAGNFRPACGTFAN